MATSSEAQVARTVRAYVGLGANVGDAPRTLAGAVIALGELPGVRRTGVSRLYRTRPVGVEDQADFHNAAVALDVPAGPDPVTGATGLLVRLKELERAFGRQRRRRWGPRELDLDLLVFGRAELAVDRPPEAVPASAAIDPGAAARLLEVPHPSVPERLFVLAPLHDLAPGLVPPGWHETIASARRRRAAVDEPDAVVAVGDWSEAHRAWLGPSGLPIEIRPAVPADADGLARAHTSSADDAYRGLVPPDRDGLVRRLRRWPEILAEARGRTFVAVDDGRIVGFTSIGADAGTPEAGEVRALYVMRGWWGTGLGQRLFDLAQRELAREFDRATLTVLEENGRARRFYERNGWRYVASEVEPHFGGRPTTVARYARTLRGAGANAGRSNPGACRRTRT